MDNIGHKSYGTRIKNIVLILVLVGHALSGCIGIRYLKDDEELLISQGLKNTEDLNQEQLRAQFLQEKNRRIPVLPIAPLVHIYEAGHKRYDAEKYSAGIEKTKLKFSGKIKKAKSEKKRDRLTERMTQKVAKYEKTIDEGNLLMRWGEPLAVYDSAKTQGTIENMEIFLHSEGYFNAVVNAEKTSIDKLVSVNYIIDKKEPYIIDSLDFIIPDENIKKLVMKESLVQPGLIFRQQTLTNERERINNLLVNNGYYGFSRQYVSFKADSSSLGDKRMIVQVLIKNPADQNSHKVYKLDSIIFTSDANTKYRATRKQKEYNGVTYDYIRDIYSTKILDWRIFINEDSIYREEDAFETQRQLSNIDNFKFVNIKYDTIGEDFIAHIYTSPFQRFETSTEFGANMEPVSQFPGPFVNFNLKNRNTFEGLENMELGFNLGINGLAPVSTTDEIYQSFEYGGRLAFTFPQFLLPLGRKLNSRVGKFNPKTILSFRLNFVDRPEYQRNTINSAITYTWQKSNNLRFSLTPADINFIRTEDIDDDFQDRLDELEAQGNTYFQSFNSAFVSSSIFTVTYDHNEYGNAKETSSFIRFFLETGGNLINIFGDSIFGRDLSYYKFIKTNIDIRRNIPISRGTSFAIRLNMGAAYPYGNGNESTLPYEKFFFAGGSNSIRAWQPRRLGPGKYRPTDPETGSLNYSFEQPGEILIESSFELRQKLFGIFSWAYFIEAGNVWTWYSDAARPGSRFSLRDLPSGIAVGSGFGLRLDFSFLLLRFDAGVKIFDPAQSGEKFVLDDFTFKKIDSDKAGVTVINNPVLNIGIGYPF